MTEDRCAVSVVFLRPQLGLVERFAWLSGLWGKIGLSVGSMFVVGLGAERG